jgi:hypothetical protein
MQFLARASVIAALAGLVVSCGDSTGNSIVAAGLLKLAGDGQTALPGAAVPESIVVRVVDEDGAGVPGMSIGWNVVSGGGTVLPATGASDQEGRLAARWVLGTAGANSVNVTAAGFGVTFTATATSNPPPASRLAIVIQPPDAQSGVAFSPQPVIQLQDAQGAPISQAGVAVTAVLDSGPLFAALNGARTAVTGANGRAVFTNLGITGPVGDYYLGFTAVGATRAPANGLSLSTVSGRVPLTDMENRTYLGFTGGLYANGSNAMPSAHASEGVSRARSVVPRALNGTPSGTGKIVLMSIGMSNTTQEWCAVTSSPCNSWSFTGRANADPAVDHTTLAIVDGAKAGETAANWTSASSPNYNRIRDNVLTPMGLSENQVQVIWLKVANPFPSNSLPSPQSDAGLLVGQMGDIVRVLHNRYPNLQMVFLSSRIYGGHATIQLNPEPYAYEGGFAVKWLIQAQIDQMASGGIVDTRAGDLDFTSAAPYLAWGPYLWADGSNPRSDGLVWLPADVESDGTHPNTAGETKVGGLLLNFFKTDARTSCWFLAAGSCP